MWNETPVRIWGVLVVCGWLQLFVIAWEIQHWMSRMFQHWSMSNVSDHFPRKILDQYKVCRWTWWRIATLLRNEIALGSQAVQPRLPLQYDHVRRTSEPNKFIWHPPHLGLRSGSVRVGCWYFSTGQQMATHCGTDKSQFTTSNSFGPRIFWDASSYLCYYMWPSNHWRWTSAAPMEKKSIPKPRVRTGVIDDSEACKVSILTMPLWYIKIYTADTATPIFWALGRFLAGSRWVIRALETLCIDPQLSRFWIRNNVLEAFFTTLSIFRFGSSMHY